LIVSNKILAFSQWFLTLTQRRPNRRRYYWEIFSYWKFFASIGVGILTHQVPTYGWLRWMSVFNWTSMP